MVLRNEHLLIHSYEADNRKKNGTAQRCPALPNFSGQGFLQQPRCDAYLCMDVTGNKNNRKNFIVRLAYERRQNYVIRNRSATVPERGAPSPSSKRRQCQDVKCRKNKNKYTCILCKKKPSLWCLCLCS